jgi:CheY-like chemotaxis protein
VFNTEHLPRWRRDRLDDVTPAAGTPRSLPKILIVDDEPDIRGFHALLLNGAGMEVFTAENGTMALDVMRRASPDVIVTDVNMPVMDGVELCRHIRADATTRDVVVVIITGDASHRSQAALDAGCDAVLEKPCSQTLLLATIQVLLDGR